MLASNTSSKVDCIHISILVTPSFLQNWIFFSFTRSGLVSIVSQIILFSAVSFIFWASSIDEESWISNFSKSIVNLADLGLLTSVSILDFISGKILQAS